MIRIDGFMSVSKMAEMEGVSRQTIHNWIRAGYLKGLYPTIWVGRTRLIYARRDAYFGYPIWRKITEEDLESAVTTVGETAKFFGISPEAVRAAIRDGRLPAFKAGKWVFLWKDASTLWGHKGD